MVTMTEAGFTNEYRGMSTDTKPVYNVPNGSLFYEIDTSDIFFFDGDGEEWVKVKGGSGGGGGGGSVTPESIGAIAAPASPTSGQFLVYNGSAWVAQSLQTWEGGSY